MCNRCNQVLVLLAICCFFSLAACSKTDPFAPRQPEINSWSGPYNIDHVRHAEELRMQQPMMRRWDW